MKYLSVCSGIEAASCAWHSLGWSPVAFSEIEPFPSAVLAHHYPSVPNWGDMTKFKEWPDAAIDVLVGGTPCQSFSVAGLRKGLDDPRGNLMLTYLAIADKYRPTWLVWENVPGVLSSNGGKDFGTFLGGLGELGYGFAYRVLDAQYVRVDSHPRAVSQRRRRVFVVGHLGDWRRAAAVLFERESLCGHPAPRREAGKDVAGRTARSVAIRGREDGRRVELGDDCANALVTPNGGRDGIGVGAILVPMVAPTLRAGGNKSGGDRPPKTDVDTCDSLIPVAHCEVMPTMMNGANTPAGHNARSGHSKDAYIVPMAFNLAQITSKTNRSRVDCSRPSSTLNAAGQMHCATSMAVRRLTPTECERLMGFPDGYTQVPNRGKPAADGPRYKALGNSMAVNCMRWIGQRIRAL